MKYENLTKEEKIRINQFLHTTFLYTDEELDALANGEKMTQEIFEKCLDTCIKADDTREFFEIWNRFPVFACEFLKRIEEETKDISKKILAEKQKNLDKFIIK